MSNRDPFEDYKKRREIEIMESRFKEKAAAQRKRIEELLTSPEGDPGDIEDRVNQEMEDFLSESTRTAEEVLESMSDEGGSGEGGQLSRSEEIRREIRNFFAAVDGDSALDDEPSLPPPPVAPLPPPERRTPAPPKPSITERRPLGSPEGGKSAPVDLRAALEKIRRHSGGAAMPPPPASEESSEPDPRREVLDSFDQTVRHVSDLIQKRIDSEEPLPAAERDAVAEDGRPSPELPDPDMEGEEGAPPPGVTNVFQAEPGEDRDLDDDVDAEEPPGWNLPVRPPPPGAWIVKKQKEEGEAGLAGSAGDTYLLKKLSQEVRRLNRVYLVLLEKKIVTREEVEGPGTGAPVRVDTPPAEEQDGDGDDDAVSIDDYDEERYRPIITSENDFSLSNLVKDVHRLNCLRDVLLKKGVVTEKELKKAK